MASQSSQYTVVGFSEDLDWKPLHFVKPLPKNRLCSLCGLVRKTAALLPCGHSACGSCFERCVVDDGHACPIDGENWPEEEVEWRDFPAENLLKREVRCWNHGRGCGLVMAASDVFKHFHRECEYHSTPCRRCSAMVLCSDMCGHLRSSCRSLTAAQVTECEEHSSDALETEEPKDIMVLVQELADEMKALLERTFTDNRALHDSVCEISQSLNSLKESMRQDVPSIGQITNLIQPIADGINTLHGAFNSEQMETVESLERVEAAIESVEEGAKASSKRLLENVKKVILHAEKNVTRCEFFISQVRSLEARAKKDGTAHFVHGPVYIRGYKMSPGVQLNSNEGSVSLHIRLQLHKGDLDGALVWPFEQNVRLSILHPLSTEPYILENKAHRSLESYKKPTASSHNCVCFEHPSVVLETLYQYGYVCTDRIRVLWELP